MACDRICLLPSGLSRFKQSTAKKPESSRAITPTINRRTSPAPVHESRGIVNRRRNMKEHALHLAPCYLEHAETPEEVGLCARRLQVIASVLNADVDRCKIPGAVVLLARNGRIAWHEAIGFEDAGESPRPMLRHSVFRIAAMTRPVVGVAALMLMEEGRLALTDPVERFIPEFARLQVGVESTNAGTGKRQLKLEPVRRAMTVHDLFRHTSGLTYGQFGDSLVQRQYRANGLMDPMQTNA